MFAFLLATWGRRLLKPKDNRMAFYESVLVFRQDLTEPQVKEKAAKFASIIKELGGDVKSTEFWVGAKDITIFKFDVRNA